MNAVVPLNVAALRVSSVDKTNVTPHFAGRTAAFEKLPYESGSKKASTGDMVFTPLVLPDAPRPALEAGVHLHWELPDYFKRGSYDAAGGQIRFPPVPTRWLVTRTLCTYDNGTYAAPRPASFVVESDFVAPAPTGGRPSVPVPLTAPDGKPFMWMGRVVDAAKWDPSTERPQDYLPAYKGPDGRPLYLTSIGFLGAGFSGYYPDCRSVFGFWDTFADVQIVHDAIVRNDAIRFRVSYSVIGWLPKGGDDPLNTLAADVRAEYDEYVAQCAVQKVDVARTPTDVFQSRCKQRFEWLFSANAISYTLKPDKALDTLDVPGSTLCAGVGQDVVWNALAPGDTPFLSTPGGPGPWPAEVELAIGNTTVEAVSALVASQLPPPAPPAPIKSYEVLLDALQLGLLRDLEEDGNTIVRLEENRHTQAFSQLDGGHEWTVQSKAAPGTAGSPAVVLPLALAEQLALLNRAQQAYDQGRAGLTVMRQQLFMDWVIFVKQLVAGPVNPFVPTNALSAFLASASGGELGAVVAEGKRVGLATYQVDSHTGEIIAVASTDPLTTLAGALVEAFGVVKAILDAANADWKLVAGPAAPLWMPADPVLVMEGERVEPARRNGPTQTIAVRADGELIAGVELATAAGAWTVAATDLPGLPVAPAAMPAAATADALFGEAALLDPQYAPAIAALTAAPDPATLAEALAAAQGGRSPIDAPQSAGLYAAVREAGYVPATDPQSAVTTPEQLTATFANAAHTALAPDAVGWIAQTALPELSPTRVDPLLPTWMTWKVELDPIARSGVSRDYAPDELKRHFHLDGDKIELTYPVPADFTTGVPVRYEGAAILSKKPFLGLTEQIDRYLVEFAGEPVDPELVTARDDLVGKRVMAQALGTFDIAQTLRTTIPQIPVADLVKSPDAVTTAIARAATANPNDTWYGTAFNSLTAISTGPQAQDNYGPLRGGFVDLLALATIDVFGQRMKFHTKGQVSGGPLVVKPSIDLSPARGDTVNAARVYLPPRVLAPARVDAAWLSAAHNDAVPGIDNDFVQSNSHPSTTPVCGWIVPNHLDVSLAFYDAGGSPIGSFGLADGDNVYTTRAGNVGNPTNDLHDDLYHADGKLKVNAHVAALMTFVDGQSGDFLRDLMSTIADSDQFIQPGNFAQDASLSVLIGRPLAIVRTVLGLTSAGEVLPVSQANTSATDALATAVNRRLYDYRARQAQTTAALGAVEFPVRLGDLTNIADGLVAFLPEGEPPTRYTTVYSGAAPKSGAHHVERPQVDTVKLTVNGPVRTFTALVDPRAPVHVTTAVLPVATLTIPPDQYAVAMAQLAVTFVTRPVLSDQLGVRLPLPVEAGFAWSWVAPDKAPVRFDPAGTPGVPLYGYGPQRLLEGWLDLSREQLPMAPLRPPEDAG